LICDREFLSVFRNPADGTEHNLGAAFSPDPFCNFGAGFRGGTIPTLDARGSCPAQA
jgi:hypothetical protein